MMSFCLRVLFVYVVLSSFFLASAGCRNATDLPSGVITMDDLVARMGDRVPAFGGMFVDEPSDILYVYMVPGQSGDVATLDQVITDVLKEGRPPEHRLVPLAARYSFRQLKAWHDCLSPQVLAIPGTVFTDISQMRNRMEVGIESPSLIPVIAALLTGLDIPREAVDLEVTTPRTWPVTAPQSDTDQSTLDEVLAGKTLRDEFRPLVGGLQIKIAVTGLASASICTMGFLATLEKKLGLVTNDHCIQEHNQRHLNLNRVYQPTIDAQYEVATGSVDPDFFKKDQNPACPADRFCRYSDSAFATLNDKANDPVGYIAKPASGSEWDGTTKFRIVGTAKSVEGMAVTRVSSQSGVDNGKISNTCQNLKATEKGKDTGTTFLCQTTVSWDIKVVSGDSGSPVFTTNRENNDVMLLGILWSDSGVSSIDQVKITGTELGPQLLVCAEGFKC
jgi:hypothetical protein